MPNKEALEKVAYFILEESDRPISEIVWLLEKVYNLDTTPKELTFEEAWGDIL
tara:strand:+ start:1200 stop:1358 length:159 start_codon:yes stop_codon:yes gene_type:complete